jgi:hypothetical protein
LEQRRTQVTQQRAAEDSFGTCSTKIVAGILRWSLQSSLQLAIANDSACNGSLARKLFFTIATTPQSP